MVDENELYEKWRNARGMEQETLREKLYHAVKRHAAAIVWKKFPEGYWDVPNDIAANVICKLDTFRGRCKFSTWVHEISKRNTDEAIRKLIRSKAVFDRTKVVEEDETDADGSEKARNRVYATVRPDFDRPIAFKEFCKHLSKNHAALLLYKLSGSRSKEIAMKMGISQEAVDSKWARLKRKLPRKI
jgi:RNA polymerase sigma factor (sigma-70 family)